MPKILIVDDEEDIREILSMMVETNVDWSILEAESGNQAIEVLKQHDDIALIFCDYRMEDGNGGDVYKFIRAEGNKVPYVMISTDRPSDHEELHTMETDNPANGYLSKPFDMKHLGELIQAAAKFAS